MELKEELKTKLIEALNLEDVTTLFGEGGFGLDSIDALELIVLLEKNYGIKIKDPKEGKDIFKSVSVMADYVAANRTK